MRTCVLLIGIVGALRAAPVPMPDPNPDPPFKAFRDLGEVSRYGNYLDATPDGRQLVIAGHSTFLFVYDLPTGKVVHKLNTEESIQDAAVSPDGKLLATAEWRHGVKVRDLKTMEVLHTVKGKADLSAAQVRFLSARRIGVHSWWGSRSQTWTYDLDTEKETGYEVFDRTDKQTSYVREWMRGGGRFLLATDWGYDAANRLRDRHTIWATDPETGKRSKPIDLKPHDLFQFDISPDGKRVIVMEPGESPRVVEMETGKTVLDLPGHARWVTAASFSPSGRLIATASGLSEDGHARCYTTKYSPRDASPEMIVRSAVNGRVIGALKDELRRHDVMRLRFSRNGQYVVAQTAERRILLWGAFPRLPDKPEPLLTGFEGVKKAK
jgi:WD40 repeat protein